MDLNKILTGVTPKTNNSRKYLWTLDWREATGEYPTAAPHTIYACRICKKPVWIKSDLKISPLDITCSSDCFMVLEELRNDKHWS